MTLKEKIEEMKRELSDFPQNLIEETIEQAEFVNDKGEVDQACIFLMGVETGLNLVSNIIDKKGD